MRRPDTLALLARAPIYVNHSATYQGDDGKPIEGRGLCFHVSAEWLQRHGNNAQKARAVELYRAQDYVEHRTSQPMVILHEYTHAYHYARHAEVDRDIHAAYDAAMQAKLYASVDYAGTPGRKVRAYAATNHREYFAEISEAYFGRNDFFPFDRNQLKAYDPKGFDLVRRLWQV